jgi:hypothetical protein
MHDAFLAGLHAGCTLIGVLCLVGAAGALVALPGRGFRAPQDDEAECLEPVAA